jgi:hypothetical protein
MRHAYRRPLTKWERRLQRMMAKLDALTEACMENEWFYVAAILFCVCGALAMIGR